MKRETKASKANDRKRKERIWIKRLKLGHTVVEKFIDELSQRQDEPPSVRDIERLARLLYDTMQLTIQLHDKPE